MLYLLIPPGWTLHPGGAHIALPLLKGYLQANGIPVAIQDLNIQSATYHGASIAESQVVDAVRQGDVGGLNDVYFSAEDRLSAVAKNFGGTWYAHEGYQRPNCDLGNPASVRDHSCEESPFTAYFNDIVIPSVLLKSPRIVGLSIYVPSQMLTAFEFARLLRRAGYDGLIVFGGNHVTRIAQDMKLPWVFDLIDGVVSYQGERVLKELYEAVDSGSPFDAIENLIWKNTEGKIVENSISTLKSSEFAPPDFGDLDHSLYWGTPYFPMIGARGCFYGKCSFCAIPYGWGPKNYIGRSHGETVISAMNDAHERFGVTRFKFVDEALHPQMLREIAKRRDCRAADFEFEGYVRFDPNWEDDKFLASCSAIGLRKAYLGLELAPSQSRNVLTKADRADPLSVLKRMKDHGIKTHIFCLFGYPGTGVDEALATVDFAVENADLIDTLDIFPFYYARHTKVAGARIIEEPERPWRTEHRYVPDGSGVMWPEEVEILAERMNDLVWRQFPRWSHPVYRMYSPWHSDAMAGFGRGAGQGEHRRAQLGVA